jgi:hypothetical protein
MKNLLTATLPALALLALGGCATSGALTTSTENDGVYYSSSDHTTTVGAPASAYNGSGTIPDRALDDTVPATTDDANPDYQGGTAQGSATGTDYYSNSYNDGLSAYTPSGFNQPYTGPGVSSYNYNPGWSVAPSFYGSPFGYGAGLALGYGYSPYGMGGFGYPYGGYGGGFYDPFYSPYGFGYGSGLSIGFGYGFGGFGGFGYPYGGYGYPYGYGYGRGYGYYDSYGTGYSRPVIYANGTRSGSGANPILVGPRGGRGGSVMNGVAPTANTGNVAGSNGGRSVGAYSPNAVALPGSGAGATGQPMGTTMPTRRDGRGGGNVVGQPTYSTPNAGTGQATTSQPTAGRRGFFGGFFGNSAGSNATGGNAAAGANSGNMGQPGMQRRSYSQPQPGSGNAAGGYSQPQRSYSQPAYSQPQRSYSQPTYSQPSGGFGGGGGGSFGGGGGGGRRGGR